MAKEDRAEQKVSFGVKVGMKAAAIAVLKNPAKHRIYSKVMTKAAMSSVIKKDDVYYAVPKDNVVRVDESIEHKNAFLPSKLVHHFIDAAKYHAIARLCLCRTRMDCTNHSKEFGCILLGEGVVDGNNLLRHVSKEEAHRYAEEVRKHGLVHTVGRTYADTLAVRLPKGVGEYHKKSMIICNCCSCCCLARVYPYGTQSFRDLLLRMPGVEVEINDNCVGCGTCVQSGVCMFGAIRIENGRARRTEDCVACGRCAEVCPHGAVEISIDESAVGETVKHLSSIVDVT